MDARELAPGLWRWTADHPAWTPDRGGPGGWEHAVGSVYYEAPEAVVLIDPLAPPSNSAEAARFWSSLDDDVERASRPVVVLVSNTYHGRSADAIAERYAGASVHVPEAARSRVACSAGAGFADRAVLPGEVHAYAISGLDDGETAFWIPAHRCLVFADAVIGAGAGSLRVAPQSWAAEARRAEYAERFRESVGRLVALDALRVLPSHGEPVLEAGAAALRRAVSAPAWGEP